MRTDPDFIFSKKELEANRQKKLSSVYLDGREYFFAWKRAFDIIVSLVIIIAVLSWLTPIVALLIFLDSGGPVFFFQRRVGRGGVFFTCYKFRSMIPNGDADKLQALPNDRRITFMGSMLRRSNIDELPQFVNVLLGQMSIIGPRPHMYADHKKFSFFIKDYEFRNLVKPGITGLAQVKGFSGPAPDMLSIFGRYQWDAFYVRNTGPGLDMRIFRRTIAQQFSFWLKPFRILFSRRRFR